MAGLFISFEGGEGSGKTTQIRLLAETLIQKGYDVLTTREPGGTPEAEKIRALLVGRDGGEWSPMAEVLLLFAARVQHVEGLIKPALAAGKIIITDRFTDSTRAYQGAGHGVSSAVIESLNTLSLGDFSPDMTLILDIDPAEGVGRSTKRLAMEATPEARTEDRFEALDLAFHTRLREGFLAIAKAAPLRCTVFDAAQAQETLAGQIAAHILQKLEG